MRQSCSIYTTSFIRAFLPPGTHNAAVHVPPECRELARTAASHASQTAAQRWRSDLEEALEPAEQTFHQIALVLALQHAVPLTRVGGDLRWHAQAA